jgi:hypothetical protein
MMKGRALSIAREYLEDHLLLMNVEFAMMTRVTIISLVPTVLEWSMVRHSWTIAAIVLVGILVWSRAPKIASVFQVEQL